MDLSTPVLRADETPVDIEALDQSFGQWVHTGRNITISKCNNDYVQKTLRNGSVYPITEHIRGRAIIISNTGYQAPRLFKDLFQQMNYKIVLTAERESQEMYEILRKEAARVENELIDSFVVLLYGIPKDFVLSTAMATLQSETLQNKPKLVYAIGSQSIVDQVRDQRNHIQHPDTLIGATGFNGMMFFLFVFCSFVHELSATDIWKLLMQFADYHSFQASLYITLNKNFFFFPNASKAVLPDDFANLDPDDLEKYRQLLEEGSVRTYNIRLMFVGLYGAGKTSTARRLMGKEIDDVTSTDGIDVHIGRCRIDLNTNEWEILDDNRQCKPFVRLSHVLRQSDVSPGSIGEEDMVLDHSNVHKRRKLSHNQRTSASSYSQSSIDTDFEIINDRPSTSSISDSFDVIHDSMDIDSEPKKIEAESLKTAHRVIKHAHASDDKFTEAATVSLWDFAGQFVYYATHQLFFSPRSIYLLVLNMEDSLDATLDDWYMDLNGKESIEAQGGVHFWLSSIYTYAKGQVAGVPPIILVGTHKDKIKGDAEEKEKTARSYFRKIRNIFHDSPISDHIQPNHILLDNSITDPSIQSLKEMIVDVSKGMFYWGESVPAKWIELEQALDDRRSDGRDYISMDELQEINNNLAAPLRSSDHLKLFLKVHHEMGTVIYFHDSEKLRNVIILEPQWIINAFRHLIRANDFRDRYGHLRKQWEEFNTSGKLDISLAENIWKMDHKYHFYENFDLLLQVLEKLDIIVRASQLLEDGTTKKLLDYYYVPCLLKEKPPGAVLHVHALSDGIRTPVLCVSFRENFLPPAVFNRVIALCLGRWPVARQGKRKLLFCGCAIFEVKERDNEDRHRLHLFFKKSKIGMRVSRYTTNKVTEVDEVVCDRVRRFVAQAIKREFRRFQRNTMVDSELEDPFFYQIQCTSTVETDVLDDGLHTLNDLENTLTNHVEPDGVTQRSDIDAMCTMHTSMDTHPYDPRTLLKEWFPDKIPVCLREEKDTVIESWYKRMPDRKKKIPLTESTLSDLSLAIGKNWWTLMIRLGVKMTTIEREEIDNPRDVALVMFNIMRRWAFQIQRPTCGMLLDAMFDVKDVTIDWEQVQNIFDKL